MCFYKYIEKFWELFLLKKYVFMKKNLFEYFLYNHFILLLIFSKDNHYFN